MRTDLEEDEDEEDGAGGWWGTGREKWVDLERKKNKYTSQGL